MIIKYGKKEITVKLRARHKHGYKAQIKFENKYYTVPRRHRGYGSRELCYIMLVQALDKLQDNIINWDGGL